MSFRIASAAVGSSSIWPLFSWPGCLYFVIAVFALYRAGVFMHEIVHLPRQRMRSFRIAWNVMYGIPMLMPSFMYSSHLDHHNWRHFGTGRDGEYLPLGARPVTHIALYLAEVPLLPALAVIRFLLLTPLSMLVPPLRRPILERFSSFVINPAYRRPLPAHEKRGHWAAMELGCFAVLVGLAAVTIGGVLPWQTLVQLYCLGAFAAGINWVRTLAAHRYRNDGAEMTYVDQLTDSVNIVGQPIITELGFPIGLKYHALHHLFPSLPYHALGEAHRRRQRQIDIDAGLEQRAPDLDARFGGRQMHRDHRPLGRPEPEAVPLQTVIERVDVGPQAGPQLRPRLDHLERGRHRRDDRGRQRRGEHVGAA